MSITNKTVLVTLKIEMLGIEERDKKLSTDVNLNYLNIADAGFYYKCKIDKRHFKPVRAAAHAARVYHRSVTVPWDDNCRLLAASKVLEYTNKMSNFKIGFENAINDLKMTWPAMILDEQRRLGPKLFNPGDYPHETDLEKFFSFSHDIKPVPDKIHLVLDIETSVVEDLKNRLDKENDIRTDNAKRDMYARLLTPVSHMADICANDKKVFDTMIKDVIDVTVLLTELSAASLGDAELNDKLSTVKSKLAGYTPGQIRRDPRLKERLGAEAAIIANELQANLGMALPVI
jgi:hypothetical protein